MCIDISSVVYLVPQVLNCHLPDEDSGRKEHNMNTKVNINIGHGESTSNDDSNENTDLEANISSEQHHGNQHHQHQAQESIHAVAMPVGEKAQNEDKDFIEEEKMEEDYSHNSH